MIEAHLCKAGVLRLLGFGRVVHGRDYKALKRILQDLGLSPVATKKWGRGVAEFWRADDIQRRLTEIGSRLIEIRQTRGMTAVPGDRFGKYGRNDPGRAGGA